ncbi:MAG: hypothetical protein CVU57_28850 [Deltaproteobacteria bacterium HGW-Deltaproteobacteria-15]|jgi:hypothetical protein|nr:MAG: hypothetical protein CVU57_28850 [Deltaproteobacteria bacterium HGW-Deltaproteobacteria-15]
MIRNDKLILSYFFIASALILFPASSYGQDRGGRTAEASKNTNHVQEAPPVSLPTVPEGAFAEELVNRLRIGADLAEQMLSSAGIEPKNGWISEYPVTPDILLEIEEGVIKASKAGRIDLDEHQAGRALADLKAYLGLNVAAAPPLNAEDRYAEASPPFGIDEFYSKNGPPVMTYYPPPRPYHEMYAWVPSPFWADGFFFSGFFILRDFHRTVPFGQRTFVVTNRFFEPVSKRVVVVDAIKRPLERSMFAGQEATVPSPQIFSSVAGGRSGRLRHPTPFPWRQPKGAHW